MAPKKPKLPLRHEAPSADLVRVRLGEAEGRMFRRWKFLPKYVNSGRKRDMSVVTAGHSLTLETSLYHQSGCIRNKEIS